MMEKRQYCAGLIVVLAVFGPGFGRGVYRVLSQRNEPINPAPSSVPYLYQEGKSYNLPPIAPVPFQDESPPQEDEIHTSVNFKVLGLKRKVARQIAVVAEKERKRQGVLWLGKELPPWDKPCPISVKLTPNGGSGASSMIFDQGRVLARSMDLKGSLDALLSTVIAHEVTHLVLADALRRPIVRWADEGAAVFSESKQERRRYRKMLPSLAADGRWMPIRRLLSLSDYPPDVMALFAQGFSLTQFLVKRKDRKTFLAFVKDGMESDWDQALKKHYGLKNVDELEKEWMKQVRGVSESTKEKESSPEPR